MSIVGMAMTATTSSASGTPGLSFESSSSVASNADGSPDALAGSHPYALTTEFRLKTAVDSEGRLIAEGGDIKDFVTELPAGLVVNPLAVTRCAPQEFATVNHTTGEDGCPNASAVGAIAIENVTPATLSERKTSNYPIYDLVPPAGSPMLFGFMIEGAPVYLVPSIRVAGDYGLTMSTMGIPQGVHMLGSAVTLWGVPAESSHDAQRGDCVESHGSCPAGISAKPLISLPTQCTTPPTVLLRVASWQEPAAFSAPASDPLLGGGLTLTACSALDFSPTLQAQAESSAADSPSGLTIHLHIPQGQEPAEAAEANLQDAIFALPAGMTLNLSRTSGLAGCPLEGVEGVNLSSSEPGHCPPGSRIATVKMGTPLLASDLEGGLYLAQQGNLPGQGSNPFGSLLALYVVAEGSGVVIKLPVEVSADPQTGQLSMHLGPDPLTRQAFMPQLPLQDIYLEFDGGPLSALVMPRTCGDYTISAALTPWTGAAPATQTATLHIGERCEKAFKPSFSAGPVSTKAGAYTPIAFALAREDGEQELKSVSSTLPGGMLAIVGNVSECPEPQASLGSCAADSLIGEMSVSVGAGPEPLTINGGEVYFTGPYGGGPFGLSLVMPAVVGPLDLGPEGRPIVIRAAIRVNRLTGQLTIATDPTGPHSIPSLIQGIVAQIRAIDVNIDHPEFTFNPTGCSPTAITAAASSTEGATAGLSTPLQMTECSALPFGPKLTASTEGAPSRADGIGLNTKIVAGYAHEANARYVRVELPKQLSARVSTLQKACPSSVFEGNPAACPAGAVVGTANTVTSVLPVPLVGPAYLVSHGGAKFPELVIVLQGDGVTVEARGETFINKSGVTSTTFPNVPEAPIPSFELHLPPGPDSILAARNDICAAELRMSTTIVAYNGLTVKESPRIAVPSCRPAIKVVRHRLHGRMLTVAVSVPYAGRLSAAGKGLARKTQLVSKPGIVTLRLKLAARKAGLHGSRHRRAHGRRRDRRRIVVKLSLLPSKRAIRSDARLSTRLTVLVRAARARGCAARSRRACRSVGGSTAPARGLPGDAGRGGRSRRRR